MKPYQLNEIKPSMHCNIMAVINLKNDFIISRLRLFCWHHFAELQLIQVKSMKRAATQIFNCVARPSYALARTVKVSRTLLDIGAEGKSMKMKPSKYSAALPLLHLHMTITYPVGNIDNYWLITKSRFYSNFGHAPKKLIF